MGTPTDESGGNERRAGMHADFVVLDADPLAMRPDGPLPAVLQTFVGGQCVFGCEASL